MKKIIALLFASFAWGMMCYSVAYSQEKLWGINNAVFHSNTDGSEYIYSFSGGIIDPESIVLGLDGFVYGVGSMTDDPAEYGFIPNAMFKIDGSGIKILHIFQDYAEGHLASIVDGGDGFIYGTSMCPVVGGFGYQIFKMRYDSTGFMAKRGVGGYAFSPDGLMRTNGGAIIGMSRGGGTFHKGFIYRIRPDLTGIDIIHNFNGESGIAPFGKLIEGQDGNLYGTTMRGGKYNFGVIFKISLTGEYTKLFDFDGNNGRWPQGGLVQDENGFLYGTTTKREKFKNGLIFRIKPDGSDYTRLYVFDEVTGWNPSGDIFLGNDGFLYGQGFRMKKDGVGFEKMNLGTLHFLRPDLIEPDVYVTTPANGSQDVSTGTTFRVKETIGALNYTLELSETQDFNGEIISTTSPTDSFEISNLKNSTPYYARVKSSMWPEYGPITSFTTIPYPYVYSPKLWGIQNNAIVYMNLDGSGYEQSFQVNSELDAPFYMGESPAFIALANQAIYGFNYYSGNSDGSLYKLDGAGIHLFGDQAFIKKSMVDGRDGFIYGIDYCILDCEGTGSIFRVNYDGGEGLQLKPNLYAFNPQGELITTHDHKILGLSSGGGANNSGFIYSVRPDLSNIDILYSFSGTDGKAPTSKLLEGDDNRLYGITSTGGVYNNGVIFRVQTDGQHFTKLHDFTSSKKYGTNPIGNLVQDEAHRLYGICPSSGLYKKGMIFRINPDGSDFTIVYNFDGTLASNPNGNLLIEGDYLYGSAAGKFFRVSISGTEFIILHDGMSSENKVFFISHKSIEQDTHILIPSEGSNQGYSFFSAAVTPKFFSLQYTLEVSKYPDFSTIAFTGSGVHPYYDRRPSPSYHPFVEIPVNNLEYSTTYYARARSSQLPYFGPVSTFKTLPQKARLFGLAGTGGPTACGAGGLAGGAVFSIELDGSNFIKHRDHPCGAGGYQGSLIRGGDNALYGVNGGVDSPEGNIFRLDQSGNYSLISNLDFWVGDFMQASTGNFYLTEPSHYVDSTDTDFSTLQRSDPNPPMIVDASILISFVDNTQGDFVNGAPLEREDGYLYGLAGAGGLNQGGTMYRVNLNGEDFQVLYNFVQATGSNPNGSMIEDSGGVLYGTTSSGIFRIQPDGTNYYVLHTFEPGSGRPPGKVILIGDTLYGSTSRLIFKLHKNGTGYSVIHQFNEEEVWYSINIITDGLGYLYGILGSEPDWIFGQGYSDFGSIFKIRTDGTEYSILHKFTNYTGGLNFADLLLVDPDPSTQSKKLAQKTITRQGAADFPTTKQERLVTLTPNPFDTHFTIDITNKNAPSNVIISDVNGRVLYKTQLSTTETNELGEELSPGLYIVRVIQGNKASVHRIIKR